MSRNFGHTDDCEFSNPAFRSVCGYFDRTLVDPREEIHGEYIWNPGQIIADRYCIVRHLGDGSASSVYLAFDQRLEKNIALKTSRYHLKTDPEEIEKFYREVALAQAITHRNVVRIYDIDEIDGQPFFSMEFLHGQTLEELIQQSIGLGVPPITLAEVQDIIRDVLMGLSAAHQVGIIHRDLKPANVMVTERGAILMDFGVAGVLQDPETRLAPDHLLDRKSSREQGRAFGSPAYMAPELWDGASASIQTDLYACGIIIYQMLYGRLPFDAKDIGEYVGKMREGFIFPSAKMRANVPRKLRSLVARLLAPLPRDRPPTTRIVQQEIEALHRTRQTNLALISALVSVMLAAILTTAGLTLLYVPSNTQYRMVEHADPLEF